VDPSIEMVPLLRVQNTLETINRTFMTAFAATLNRDIDVAARINQGIAAMEQALSGVSRTIEMSSSFIFAAQQLAQPRNSAGGYRKLTLHRYHPHTGLGGVSLFLDFSRDRMLALIEQGFADAVDHDCAASHCILPQ
jgi:hypothetical protein